MTPTSVYFILQLDNIRHALLTLCGIVFALYVARKAIPMLGWVLVCSTAEEKEWEKLIKTSPPWSSLVVSATIMGIMMAFIPDTKTAAAVVIAPQIANSQMVQRDIPELYTLAIGKLKSALGAEPPKPEAAEK